MDEEFVFPELGGSEVSHFFSGRHVLITGATGFVGKALLEKLLRCCPDVDTVYLLLRSSQGVDPQERLKRLLAHQVFDRLRCEQADVLRKCHAVPGDLEQPELGLEITQRQLLCEQVSVVLHVGACARLEDGGHDLKRTVFANVQGTKSLVQLAISMPHLVAFVHVSSAYSNADKLDIGDHLYPPPAEPEAILSLVNGVHQDVVDALLPTLLGGHPDPVTYTKALAEAIVARDAAFLPAAILRPSMVTAAWRDPSPGWICDRMTGINRIFLGVTLGSVRSIHCDKQSSVDLIPVDLVVNAIMTAACRLHTNRPSVVPVYNCTSSKRLTWLQLRDLLTNSARQWPSTKLVAYPGFNCRLNLLGHRISQLLLQFVPAIALELTGIAPGLITNYHAAVKTDQQLEFYSTNDFRFEQGSMRNLSESLNRTDKERFPVDMAGLEWKEYLNTYVRGLRQYVMQEDSSSLTSARSRQTKVHLLQRMCQGGLLLLILRLLLSRYKSRLPSWQMHLERDKWTSKIQFDTKLWQF